MTPADDDLLVALRDARPVLDREPDSSSPEARAMLARILAAGQAQAAPHQVKAAPHHVQAAPHHVQAASHQVQAASHQVQAASHRVRAVPVRPGRLRFALPAGAAVAAAMVTGIALTLTAGVRPPGGSHPAGSHSAAGIVHTPAAGAAIRLLADAATAASRHPAPRVRASQYEYVASKITNGGAKPHLHQIWVSVSNECRRGLLEDPAEGYPHEWLTDSTQGEIVGSPTNSGAWRWRPVPEPKCPDRGNLNGPTYWLLRTFPTDPRTLLNLIYATNRGYRPATRYQVFAAIGELLNDSIMPPQLSAALYRAAAMIPGVVVVPDAADALGRHGVAVAFASAGERDEWIFSRTKLQLLGERTIRLPSGRTVYASAVLRRAFVNKPGSLPR